MNAMEVIQLQVDEFITRVKKQEPGTKIAEWPDEKVKELCIKLIKEESKEMLDAMEIDDWVEIIDGAADTIFVVLYAMSKAGIRLNSFWQEVCRTNLEKVGGPIDKETGKQLKPEGWKPPRIKELLLLEQKRLELLFRVLRKGQVAHRLKTHVNSFDAVHSGAKSHEWRKNDRRFQQGDILILQEFDEKKEFYTGRELICAVTYVTYETDMMNYYRVQISPDTNWAVMSIVKLYELDVDWFSTDDPQPWRESINAKAFEK